MIVVSTCPLLKTFIAGMEVIWYFMARSGFSSTFSLSTVILSGLSAWISSRTGATMRQGPHQAAQKSTSTGPSACSTSCSQVADVVALAVISFLLLWEVVVGHNIDRTRIVPGARGTLRRQP